MNYFLLKLAFDTAVHFGGSDSAVGSQSSALTLRADTIFSALCHTALEVYGEPALEELLISADADALRISDAMPWRGNSFYLPKPIAASTSPAELSTVERKAVKKLAWIPVSKFDRYTASLHSGTYPLDELDQSFGQAYEQTKASVTDGADAKPYFVGLYRLHAGCGLYVLCACEGNDQLKMLKELFTLLGLSGIGGRTSAGYGRFHLDGEPICLNTAEDASLRWMLQALERCTTLELHGAPLQMEPLGSHSVENGLQLLLAAREEPASRTRLWFRTPCAFKQAGRYAIYPQEFLLLQSLVLHWNTAFPDCQLSDPDALDAILRGLRILDYNLHTVSYPIKNTRIPGFVGSAVVEARLALPLLELWNALLSFAPYGGIGIKTTLGMGGVSVEPLVLPQKLR